MLVQSLNKMHMKYVLHNKFRIIFHDQRKTPVVELLFNIVAGLEDCNSIKKRFPHVLSCEYCEIFKKTYFEEYLRTAASVLLTVKLLIKYWTSVLNQKQHGMVSATKVYRSSQKIFFAGF